MSEDQVIDVAFKTIEYGISGLNLSPNYLGIMSSMIPSDIVLSSPVDFPYGLSDTKVRQHQTLSLIRRGANAIDLVVNPIYIINNKKEKLVNDIQAHQTICADHNITLRLMLEYRHFSNEVYSDLIKICKIRGIRYMFPSTGHFADDYMDNLVMGKFIKSQCPDINIITNGNIWKKEHYDTIVESDIYGMRVKFQYNLDLLSKYGV